MYNAATFRLTVIDPALHKLGLYSPGMSDLLLGTAVHESGGFKWSTQRKGGPARGYFQMEGNTHDDIWANYLKYHKHLADSVRATLAKGETAAAETLITNPVYAAAMAAAAVRSGTGRLPSISARQPGSRSTRATMRSIMLTAS